MAIVLQLIAGCAAAVISVTLLALPAAAEGPASAIVSVCFTPAERCTSQIVTAIDAATMEIRVQAYGYTSAPILKALANAKGRGVDVEVILDKSNLRQTGGGSYTGATFMKNAGVPVWIDPVPGIAHSKVIVIDRHLVIGGSFNFTKAAEDRNSENVTFLRSDEVVSWFLADWRERRNLASTH